jgi:alcohol dehydrogenase (cytochrome c)
LERQRARANFACNRTLGPRSGITQTAREIAGMSRWIALGALLAIGAGILAGAARAATADDWITINKNYSSQRYVDLDQINPANIGKLHEVCEIQLNEPILFSTGLLKVGRTLYVNTARFTVAFDAATCAKRWQYIVKYLTFPIGNNNRGSAYLDGKIFRGTPDGQLIALDAKTGAQLWPEVVAANTSALETLVSAPIAWQGKVFIGIGVGDLAIAGRLMAFDANSGKRLWSFNTTLGALFGGGFWNSYSLDPETGEVFAPVANPRPDFNRKIEPGDRDFTQYTDSVIVVNAATGRLDWHVQLVPGDDHDWDLAAPPTLYQTAGGKEMVAVTGKSGRVYGIDRTTHFVLFDTPVTTMVNDQVQTNAKWTYVCPGVQGGAQFNGPAYDPLTGMLYTGQNDHCAWYVRAKQYLSGLAGAGGYVFKDWAAAAKREAPRGWITGLDGRTGEVRWTYHAESQVQAGMVPTKSGLLFAGDTHGHLLVFNAANGTLIRSIGTGGALNSGLISYSVGGVQYVAANVGGPTENPSTVAGPLRVVVYGVLGSGPPNVVTLPRLNLPPPPTKTANAQIFDQACAQCHGDNGEGISAPPILRQSQLADPKLLKTFLETVLPPMPHLYPGLLDDNDVAMIAAYLKDHIFKCGPDEPQSCAAPQTTQPGDATPWRVIYSDLTSPRCINCHPVASSKLPKFPPTSDDSGYPQDYPRQGNDRHPHYFGVLRGDTVRFETAEQTGFVYPGEGTPFERCTFCHGTKNNPVTGIPGTTNPHFNPGQPFWFLAPASMAWESSPGIPLSSPLLCANLLNKKLNGNRTPDDLLRHIETEPLVHWSFHPGIQPNGQARTTPPYSQDQLIAAFKAWIGEGTPCPAN